MNNSEYSTQTTAPQNRVIHQLIKSKSSIKARLYKTLMKTYYLLITGPLGYGPKHPISNISIFIKQMQLNYLILDDGSDSKLNNFKPLMIHNYKFYQNYENNFLTFAISFCLSLVISLFLLFIQIYFKKDYLRSTMIFVSNVLTFVFKKLFQLGIYLCTIITLNDSGQSLSIKVLSCIYFIPLVFHVIIFSSVSYKSQIKSLHYKSRSNSLFEVKHELALLIICFIKIISTNTYFLVMTSFLSIYLFLDIYRTTPYYKSYQNLIQTVFWLSAFTSSVLNLFKIFSGIQISCFVLFLVITPTQYLLIQFKLEKRREIDLDKDPKDPFYLEKQIRQILTTTQELNEEVLRNIENRFVDGTKKFFEFEMLYIWEFNFIVESIQNLNLAAVKLSKILFVGHNQKFLDKNRKIFTYPLRFEYDFLFYFYKKLLKNIDIGTESTTIKFNHTLTKLKYLDYQVCKSLISVIKSLSIKSGDTISTTIKKLEKFSKLYEHKNNFYEKSLKVYGNDRILVELHESFKFDLLKGKTEKETMVQKNVKNNFLEKLTGERRFLSQIIVSGNPDTFGLIFSANDFFIHMLKFPNENIVLGIKLEKLIPAQIWKPHKVLLKFLLFSYSDSFIKEKLFLFNFFGYLVEVKANIRVTFVRGQSQFLVDLEEKVDQSFVIFHKSGEIISKSEIFQSIIHKSMKNILELFPDILDYLVPDDEGKEILYETAREVYYLIYEEIRGHKKDLILLYLRKEDKSFTICSTLNRFTIQSERRKSMFYGEGFFEEKGNMSKNLFIGKRTLKKQKSDLGISEKRFNSKINKIGVGIKILKVGFWVYMALQCLVYLGFIVYFKKYFDDTTLTTALYDICSNRYHLSAIIMNLRSIDLIQQNIQVGRTFADYNQSFYNSVNFTEYWLKTMEKYGNLYNLKDTFSDPEITIYDVLDDKLVPRKQNLMQGVFTLVDTSYQIMYSNYSNTDSIRSIYKSTFYSLQHQINQSAYISYNTIKGNASSMLSPLLLLNILSLIPSVIFFIIFSIGLYFLHKLSNKLWTHMMEKSSKFKYAIMKKLTTRIIKLHNPSFSCFAELTENKVLGSFLPKRFLFKFLIFFLFIIFYFLLTNQYFYFNLEEIIKMRIDFRFYAGLRSATIRSYCWAREAELHKTNQSYSDIFNDYLEVKSEKEMALSYLSDLKFLLKHTLEITTKLNNHYNYQDCLDYLVKDCCKYLTTYLSCNQTTLMYGSYNSQMTFIEEIRMLIEGKEQNMDLVVKLEKDIKKLEASFSKIVELFDLTKNDIKSIKNSIKTSSICMIFGVFLLGFILLYLEILNIKNELISRNDFLMQFISTESTLTGKVTTLK